jgi:hypothetical protein
MTEEDKKNLFRIDELTWLFFVEVVSPCGLL